MACIPPETIKPEPPKKYDCLRNCKKIIEEKINETTNELRANNQSLSSSNQTLVDINEKLEKEKNELTVENKELKTTKENLLYKIERLLDQKWQSTQKIKVLDDKIQTLTKRKTRLIEDKKKCTSQIERQKSEISSLNKQLKNLDCKTSQYRSIPEEPFTIIVGQSCALSGPLQKIGHSMRHGLMAYFKEISSGIDIKLQTYDDGYESLKAIDKTKKLLNKDKVLLLIGYVGTPTSKAVLSMEEVKNKIPFIGPFTGAEFLRELDNVINLRASYNDEMEKIAQFLINIKKKSRISCFYQNDAFGQAGLNAIKFALENRNMSLVSTGYYERNTLAVEDAITEINDKSPVEAVIMVGAYKPCAKFIKYAKRTTGMKNAIFCNISFVFAEALRDELGDDGEGCVISQVMPWFDKDRPIVRNFLAAMQRYDRKVSPDSVSLEGYMVGYLFHEILKSIPKTPSEISRPDILQAFSELGTIDIGEIKLQYGIKDNQGMDEVYLTVIKDGKIVPINP